MLGGAGHFSSVDAEVEVDAGDVNREHFQLASTIAMTTWEEGIFGLGAIILPQFKTGTFCPSREYRN